MISTPMKLLVSYVAALAYVSGNVRVVDVIPFVGAVKLRLQQPNTAHSASVDKEPSGSKGDWMSVMNETAESALRKVLLFFGLEPVPDDMLVSEHRFPKEGVDLLHRHDGKWVLTFVGQNKEQIKSKLLEQLSAASKHGVRNPETWNVKYLKAGQVISESGLGLYEEEGEYLLSWLEDELEAKRLGMDAATLRMQKHRDLRKSALYGLAFS